jgi:hypothetical protein
MHNAPSLSFEKIISNCFHLERFFKGLRSPGFKWKQQILLENVWFGKQKETQNIKDDKCLLFYLLHF